MILVEMWLAKTKAEELESTLRLCRKQREAEVWSFSQVASTKFNLVSEHQIHEVENMQREADGCAGPLFTHTNEGASFGDRGEFSLWSWLPLVIFPALSHSLNHNDEKRTTPIRKEVIWELLMISHKHFVLIPRWVKWKCTTASWPPACTPRPLRPGCWCRLGRFKTFNKHNSTLIYLFIYLAPLNSESQFVVAMRCNAGILQKH